MYYKMNITSVLLEWSYSFQLWCLQVTVLSVVPHILPALLPVFSDALAQISWLLGEITNILANGLSILPSSVVLSAILSSNSIVVYVLSVVLLIFLSVVVVRIATGCPSPCSILAHVVVVLAGKAGIWTDGSVLLIFLTNLFNSFVNITIITVWTFNSVLGISKRTRHILFNHWLTVAENISVNISGDESFEALGAFLGRVGFFLEVVLRLRICEFMGWGWWSSKGLILLYNTVDVSSIVLFTGRVGLNWVLFLICLLRR